MNILGSKKLGAGGVKAAFTDRTQAALALAAEEARRYGHNYLGQEHLLLGMLRVDECVAARVLSTFGVNLDRVRTLVEQRIGRGDRAASGGEVPLTGRAKRTLELAVQEAESMEHRYVGTEHILLGILREGHGMGYSMLLDLDVHLEAVRRAVMVCLTSGDFGVTRSNVMTVRVSDRDLDAIDALVESGVRSTRSDAASWLICMAIDANPETFKRAYATVTEIRRLRGETQAAIGRLSSETKDTVYVPEKG